MRKLLLNCFRLFYLPYAIFFGLLYPFVFLPFLLIYRHLRRRGTIADSMRIHNQLYGRFMLAISRPFIRTEIHGCELVPSKGPCVIICNHRSSLDIFFCSVLPLFNINVSVRTWPFRIFLVGRFMRMAEYIDIESLSIEEVLATSRNLARAGVSFLFFPEGHRSRDGRLQRFRSGAFRVAAENDLPIVPVCLTETEKLLPFGTRLPFPAKIRIEVLSPVFPSSLPYEKRALRLRRDIENRFREHLGEQ